MGLQLSCSRSFVGFIFVFVGLTASAFKKLQVSFGHRIIPTRCRLLNEHKLGMGSNDVLVYDAVTKKFRLEPITEKTLLPQEIQKPTTRVMSFKTAKLKWIKYRELLGKAAGAKEFQFQDLITALMDPKLNIELDNAENNNEDIVDSSEVFITEEELESLWADQHLHNMKGQTFSLENALLLLDSENDANESNEPTTKEFILFSFPTKKKNAAAATSDLITTNDAAAIAEESVTITMAELERIWNARSEIPFGLPAKKFTPENALLLLDDDEDEFDQDIAFGSTEYLEARFISEEDLTKEYFNQLAPTKPSEEEEEDDDDYEHESHGELDSYQQEQHLREVKAFIDLQETVYSPRGGIGYDVTGQVFLEPMLWSQSRIDSQVLLECGEDHPYHQLVKKLEPHLYSVAKGARNEDEDPFNQKVTPIWEVVGIDKELMIGDMQTLQQYIESQVPKEEWQLPEYLRGIITRWPKRLHEVVDDEEDEVYDRYLEEKKMKRPEEEISALLTMLPDSSTSSTGSLTGSSSGSTSDALAKLKSQDVSIQLAEALSDDTMIGKMTKAEFIHDLQLIDDLLAEQELDVVLHNIEASTFSEDTLQHRYTYRIPGEELEVNYVQFTDDDPTEEDDPSLDETDEFGYDFSSTKKKSPLLDSQSLWKESDSSTDENLKDERLGSLLQYYEQERKKLTKDDPFGDFDIITGEYLVTEEDEELKKKLTRAKESASKMIAKNLIDQKTADLAINKIISDHKASALQAKSAKEKAYGIFKRWQQLSDPFNDYIYMLKHQVLDGADEQEEDEKLQAFINQQVQGLENDIRFKKHLKQWMSNYFDSSSSSLSEEVNDDDDEWDMDDDEEEADDEDNSHDSDFETAFAEFIQNYRSNKLPALDPHFDNTDFDDDDGEEDEEQEFWRNVLKNDLRRMAEEDDIEGSFIMPEFYPNFEFEIRNITNENRKDPTFDKKYYREDHREIFKYPLDKFFEPFLPVLVRIVKAEVDELEKRNQAFLDEIHESRALESEVDFDLEGDDYDEDDEDSDNEDKLQQRPTTRTRTRKAKDDVRTSLMLHFQQLIRRYLFKEFVLTYSYPGQLTFQSQTGSEYDRVWEAENPEDPIEVFIIERLHYLKELDHQRIMQEGSEKHRFPKHYFDHPRWKDHVDYDTYSQYNSLLFSDEHMLEDDVLTILGLRKFREKTDKYVTNHHDRTVMINKAKANDRFFRAKLHDPSVTYPVKEEVPMYMTPDKHRGIEYTDTIIEMRSKMVLEPKSAKYSDGPYTTNEDAIQTYEGGTFLELYNPTPLEGLEYVIEQEKVKIIKPAMRYINYMATLQSTKDDIFIFKYHSQMRHLNGARNCMLEMIKNLYPPTKDVRLETTRTMDGVLAQDMN